MYCKFMCNVFEYAWIQTSKFRPRKVAETNDVEATDKLLAYHKQLLTLAKSEFSLTGLVYYYLRLWRWVGAINKLIMRPSSLGGGRILRRTLSVRLSVCLCVRPIIVAIGNVFSSTASVTDVLSGTHWGPHIARPSRPHRFLFNKCPPNTDDVKIFNNTLLVNNNCSVQYNFLSTHTFIGHVGSAKYTTNAMQKKRKWYS